MKPKASSPKKRELNAFEQVYEIVRLIPRGKVFTYGLISKRMNRRLSAAAVGWALNGLGNGKSESPYNSDNVPWHRVINSQGKLSTQTETAMLSEKGQPVRLQRLLLENEGVRFKDDESVDLKKYLWDGES